MLPPFIKCPMARKSIAHIRKPQIIKHCYEVLAEEGFENTTLRKVAQHMGVSQSLVSHYFQSKENLLTEVLDYMIYQMGASDTPRHSKIEDPEARLDKALEVFFSGEKNDNFSRKVFLGFIYHSLMDENIHKKLTAIFEDLNNQGVNELERYYEGSGEMKLKDREEMEDLARLFAVILDGYRLFAAISPETYKSDKWLSRLKNLYWHIIKNPEIFIAPPPESEEA